MGSNIINLFKAKLLKANIIKRAISASVLLPLFLMILYRGGTIYTLSIMLLSIIVMYEWCSIVRRSNTRFRYKFLWYLLGIIYGVLIIFSMIFLRSQYDLAFAFQHKLMLWICLMVWTTDTAAYFGGIAIGGPKIAPKISPSKTWSGFLCAIIACIVVHEIAIHTIIDRLFNVEMKAVQWISAIGTCIVSQIGDFLESGFKRKFQVKDSGRIIPGHGGVMDRIDGLTTVSIVWCIIIIISELLSFH